MRRRTLSKAVACTALVVAGGAWVGCTAILGDFSTSNASDGGVDGTTDGPLPSDAARETAPADTGPGDAGPGDANEDTSEACSANCPGGTPCTTDTICATGTCDGGTCTSPNCAIDASCGPGTACENGGTCASGNCLDGVCCTVSACPQCLNCGTTGTCNVPVLGKDDTTATSCSGNSTCVADGGCVQRWVQVGSTTAVSIPSGEYGYAASAGNVLYFSASNGAAATGMEGFDTTTNTFAAYPKDQSMCWCGGWPAIVGGVIGTTQYLFSLWDGQLDYWSPGASSWSTATAHPSNDDSSVGLLGTTVYSISGTSTATYGLTAPNGASWSTLGSLPGGAVEAACTASDPTTNSIYMFGGNGTNMYMYSAASNAWSQMTVTGAIPSCYYAQAVPIWEGNIAYASPQGVALFDIATSTWIQDLPLPPGTWLYVNAFSPTSGGLYLLAFDGTNDVIFKWNLY